MIRQVRDSRRELFLRRSAKYRDINVEALILYQGWPEDSGLLQTGTRNFETDHGQGLECYHLQGITVHLHTRIPKFEFSANGLRNTALCDLALQNESPGAVQLHC